MLLGQGGHAWTLNPSGNRDPISGGRSSAGGGTAKGAAGIWDYFKKLKCYTKFMIDFLPELSYKITFFLPEPDYYSPNSTDHSLLFSI
jgi:hypothetical protein